MRLTQSNPVASRGNFEIVGEKQSFSARSWAEVLEAGRDIFPDNIRPDDRGDSVPS